MKPFALSAPAKINLTLEILGKRPDGYHELRMLMAGLGLADRLAFRAAPDWRLACSRPDLGAGEDNLVTRAARLLQATPAGRRRGPLGAAVRVTKNIPLGAGLAGGSSDAAQALRGLNRLWNLKLGPRALHALARRLGSDVPYCLQGGWALARGRGEKLKGLSGMPDFWVALLNPGFQVSTAWAFSRARPAASRANRTLEAIRILQRKDLAKLQDACVNDLEPVTAGRHPEIRKMKRLLLEQGAIASQMSGSGPSVWGLFSTKQNALKAVKELKKKVNFCIVAQTISKLA